MTQADHTEYVIKHGTQGLFKDGLKVNGIESGRFVESCYESSAFGSRTVHFWSFSTVYFRLDPI